MADLGKASRLFPMIEESLKTARPKGLELRNLTQEQASLYEAVVKEHLSR